MDQVRKEIQNKDDEINDLKKSYTKQIKEKEDKLKAMTDQYEKLG